ASRKGAIASAGRPAPRDSTASASRRVTCGGAEFGRWDMGTIWHWERSRRRSNATCHLTTIGPGHDPPGGLKLPNRRSQGESIERLDNGGCPSRILLSGSSVISSWPPCRTAGVSYPLRVSQP